MQPSDPAVNEWPNPPDQEVIDNVEAASRPHRQEFIKAAKLSSAEQGRFEAILSEMNKKVEEVFGRVVAERMRNGEPLSDDERSAFLNEFAAAVQSADEAVAKLNADAASAMASAAFMAATQLDAENALRVATYHRRYVEGSGVANADPTGTPQAP